MGNTQRGDNSENSKTKKPVTRNHCSPHKVTENQAVLRLTDAIFAMKYICSLVCEMEENELM